MNKRNNIIILIIFFMFVCFFGVKNFISKNSDMIFESKKNIFVMPDQTVNGNVTSIKGDIYINGTVNGNVKSIKGNIYVNGKVTGDVTSVLGNVNKGENAEIRGKIAEKNGVLSKTFNYVGQFGHGFKNFGFGSFILLTILCLIVYEISPFTVKNLSNEMSELGLKSLVLGYFIMFLTCVVLFFLVISIIGILAIPIIAIILILQLIVGFTTVMMFIGNAACKLFNVSTSERWILVIGVFIYQLLMLIPYGSDYIYILLILPLSIGIGQYSKFGIYRPRRRNLV